MKLQEKPLLLLNTNNKNEIQVSGGRLLLPNGDAIRLDDIVDVEIVAPRPEVLKVETIGTTAPTITTSTAYQIRININGVTDQGWRRFEKVFRVVSLATIADQTIERTRIYAALAAQINRESSLYITAVATAATNITLTDDAGYWTKGRKGASTIKLLPDDDGRGFVDLTHRVITTAAVFAAGIGTDLIRKQPLVDPLIGNAYVGSLDNIALRNAVAGQRYTTFVITSIVTATGTEVIADTLGLKKYVQILLIDDGTGTVTTNAANFGFALKALEYAKYYRYNFDRQNLIYIGDETVLNSAAHGGAAALTDAAENVCKVGAQTFFSTLIGAAATLATGEIRNGAAGGLIIDADATASEGREIHMGVNANDLGYIVGRQTVSIRAIVNMSAVANPEVLIGFRIKAAVAAAYTTYTDYVFLGNAGAGAAIETAARLNTGTALITALGINAVDATDIALEVVVLANGRVRAHVNNSVFDVLVAAGTPLVLDAGDEIIPVVRSVSNGTASIVTLRKLFIIGDDENRNSESVFLA